MDPSTRVKAMIVEQQPKASRSFRLGKFGLVLCTVVLVGCIVPKVDIKPPKEVTVSVTKVISQDIPRQYRFTGTLQAVKSVDIMSRVSGYIQSRDFVEGSIVKKGQLLYQIDPRPFQAQLDAALAQKEKDEASLAYWEIEVKRYTALAEKGAGSVERQQSTIARVAELKAAIQRDNANIKTAELNLGYTKITAPFDSRIQATQYNVGALVKENVDTLTTAVQVDPIYVLFNVSRMQLSQIQSFELDQSTDTDPSTLEGSKVTLMLPNGKTYSESGKVDYLSAKIDPTTDMLEFRAVFKNQFKGGDQVELLPGQYCPLTLELGEIKDAILIPQTALVQGQLGNQVYVVGGDNTIEARDVVVGSEFESFFVVTKGLKAGEQIVKQGVQKVRPGAKVKVQADSDAAPN